jgi:hypothetical protein
MRLRILAVPLIATLFLGCGRQTPLTPNTDDPAAIAPIDLSELHRIAHQPLAGNGKIVEVPAARPTRSPPRSRPPARTAPCC